MASAALGNGGAVAIATGAYYFRVIHVLTASMAMLGRYLDVVFVIIAFKCVYTRVHVFLGRLSLERGSPLRQVVLDRQAGPFPVCKLRMHR